MLKDEVRLTNYIKQNHNIPIKTLFNILHNELNLDMTKDGYKMSKILSMHCILNLFEVHQDSNITKRDAYDSYKLWFTHTYSKDVKYLNKPNFGKLVKLLFDNDKVKSKRIGSRSISIYCYSNLKLSKHASKFIDSKVFKIDKITYIDEFKKFNTLKISPNFSIIDLKFVSFLNNELNFQDVRNEDLKLINLDQLLTKSDLLLKNFINSFDDDLIFQNLINDWIDFNVPSLIKTTIKYLNSDYKDLNFEMIEEFIHLVKNPYQYFERIDDPSNYLIKYYKIDSILPPINHRDNSLIIYLKWDLTIFLIKILTKFPHLTIQKFQLNFKFITTSILRYLTIKRGKSFSSYWILSCFLDEYLNFLLEFHCHKKE